MESNQVVSLRLKKSRNGSDVSHKAPAPPNPCLPGLIRQCSHTPQQYGHPSDIELRTHHQTHGSVQLQYKYGKMGHEDVGTHNTSFFAAHCARTQQKPHFRHGKPTITGLASQYSLGQYTCMDTLQRQCMPRYCHP